MPRDGKMFQARENGEEEGVTQTFEQRVAQIANEEEPRWWNALKDTERAYYNRSVSTMLWYGFRGGVAAGLRATPDPKYIASTVVRDVAELSDRTSPEGYPEMMLVTGEELYEIVERAVRNHRS